MASTVNASAAWNLAGGALREDLMDVIYDISPMDTTFLTMAGRGSCNSTLHEWQTDALVAAANNSAIEGDDFSAVARALPSRLKNYTNISRKDIVVTGTSIRGVAPVGANVLSVGQNEIQATGAQTVQQMVDRVLALPAGRTIAPARTAAAPARPPARR